MDIFFGDGPIDSLADILSENFTFKGPFYTFDSAEAYLESLKTDPPEGMTYNLIESYENDNSACLIYLFTKQNVSTVMSQTFKVASGKIADILLVFDSADFN